MEIPTSSYGSSPDPYRSPRFPADEHHHLANLNDNERLSVLQQLGYIAIYLNDNELQYNNMN